MNVFLKFAYDGTNYSGFQFQANAISVQEKIENALYKIYKQDIRIKMASRTDKGVHALGQCATFQIDDLMILIANLPQVINNELPKDIICNFADIVDDKFHPRFDAKEKIYEYLILNNDYPIPIYRNLSHYHRKTLDYTQMEIAAKKFLGTHDFIGFSTKGSFVKDTIRTIYEIDLFHEVPFIKIRVRGNAFLYNMIRIIAGTLLDVGRGKKSADEIEEIILSKDRRRAGVTLSPQGLTLIEIIY